jgi:hypothetical protein
MDVVSCKFCPRIVRWLAKHFVFKNGLTKREVWSHKLPPLAICLVITITVYNQTWTLKMEAGSASGTLATVYSKTSYAGSMYDTVVTLTYNPRLTKRTQLWRPTAQFGSARIHDLCSTVDLNGNLHFRTVSVFWLSRDTANPRLIPTSGNLWF